MYYVFRERLFVVKNNQLTDVVTNSYFTAAYTRMVIDPEYAYPAKPVKDVNAWLNNKLSLLKSKLAQDEQRLIYASGESRFRLRERLNRFEKDILVYSNLLEE